MSTDGHFTKSYFANFTCKSQIEISNAKKAAVEFVDLRVQQRIVWVERKSVAAAESVAIARTEEAYQSEEAVHQSKAVAGTGWLVQLVSTDSRYLLVLVY